MNSRCFMVLFGIVKVCGGQRMTNMWAEQRNPLSIISAAESKKLLILRYLSLVLGERK